MSNTYKSMGSYLSDYLGGKYTPVTVYHYTDFKRIIIQNGWQRAKEIFEENWRKSAEVAEYRWGGSHLRLANIFGDEFRFAIYDGRLVVWDLVNTMIAKADLTKNVDLELIKMLSRTEERTRGFVHCSHCDLLVEYHRITDHRYFAGIYCDDCWNNTFREIEAKENYN